VTWRTGVVSTSIPSSSAGRRAPPWCRASSGRSGSGARRGRRRPGRDGPQVGTQAVALAARHEEWVAGGVRLERHDPRAVGEQLERVQAVAGADVVEHAQRPRPAHERLVELVHLGVVAVKSGGGDPGEREVAAQRQHEPAAREVRRFWGRLRVRCSRLTAARPAGVWTSRLSADHSTVRAASRARRRRPRSSAPAVERRGPRRVSSPCGPPPRSRRLASAVPPAGAPPAGGGEGCGNGRARRVAHAKRSAQRVAGALPGG